MLGLFEYVDKTGALSVAPSAQAQDRAPDRGKKIPESNRKLRILQVIRKEDGGQTEDPHGEREAQQEHHSAGERGQVDGES